MMISATGGGSCRGNRSGGGATDPLARGAHREGGRRHVHVKLRRRRSCGLRWWQFESLQILKLLVQPPVLVGQRLATLLQELTIHLRLLQFRPVPNSPQTRNLISKKSPTN
ncbi:unnamed protein product [Linum trigynum]|uniref:Uncharacterized protein n=1 Tax=Linum trigynum TaxID=586398 RepID=A0AAV2E5Z9_9ROSI